MTQEEWDRKFIKNQSGEWELEEEELLRQIGRSFYANACISAFASNRLENLQDSEGRMHLMMIIIANHLGDLNETLKEISAKLK